jgi:hypothetical protein
MNWERLYRTVLNVYPKTRDVLPQLLMFGQAMGVDPDAAYMHVMRPFLAHTGLDEKDVVAATMRQICEKVEAFACIFQSEAWQRSYEERADIPDDLSEDAQSVEVVISSMETHDFARMITVPIQRKRPRHTKERDAGKIVGFGDAIECVDSAGDKNVLQGRLVRFLKPLEASS